MAGGPVPAGSPARARCDGRRFPTDQRPPLQVGSGGQNVPSAGRTTIRLACDPFTQPIWAGLPRLAHGSANAGGQNHSLRYAIHQLMQKIGTVAPSAHQIGNAKSAVSHRTMTGIQKIFRCIGLGSGGSCFSIALLTPPPSFQRKMPPNAEAERGASFQPSVKSMPLIRWTIRSPPTPVPYSFQQRQRAKRYLSKGILGASFSQVSQSRLAGERSSGGGYSQAPVGSLRPKVSSTISTTPMAPDLYSSLALPHSTELTRCDPICTMRLFFWAASIISNPCAAACDIGFSQ